MSRPKGQNVLYCKLVAALVGSSTWRQKARQGKTFVRLANLQKIEKGKKERDMRSGNTGLLTGLPLLSCSVPIPADLTGGLNGPHRPQRTTIRDTGSDGSDPLLTPFRFLIYHGPRNENLRKIFRDRGN